MAPVRHGKRGREDSDDGEILEIDRGGSSKSTRRKEDSEDDARLRTVCVSQLTSKVTEKHLKDFFGEISQVKDVAMPRNDSGKHKGVAYVEFEKASSISDILLLNNQLPNFQKFPILVNALAARMNDVAPPPSRAVLASVLPPPPRSVPSQKSFKMLINNIPLAVQNSDLMSVLNYYGAVSEMHLNASQDNKKMAFVTFSNEEAVRAAREDLQGFELVPGVKLAISMVKSSSQEEGGRGDNNNNNNNNNNKKAKEIRIYNLPLPSDPQVEQGWLAQDMKKECEKVDCRDTSIVVDRVHEQNGSAEYILSCTSAEDARRVEKALDGRYYSGKLVTAKVVTS